MSQHPRYNMGFLIVDLLEQLPDQHGEVDGIMITTGKVMLPILYLPILLRIN